MNNLLPTQSRFRVGGMDCASCAAKIETAVRRIEGVDDVAVSVSAGTLNVTHHSEAKIGNEITKAVTSLGYSAEVLQPRAVTDDQNHEPMKDAHDPARDDHSHNHGASHEGPWWQSPKAQLTLVCGVAIVGAYAISKLFPAIGSWAFVTAMAVGLVPIARRAFQAARAGTPFSIEMLMTIAAVGAVLIGATEEAATVVFLFLIGELLEGVAAGRARASIKSLTTLVPKTAQLEQDGVTSEVGADKLAVGSVILVRPGDRLPADGEILSGESSIDEAPVTGESTPKRKGVSDSVFAGTINLDGA